MVRPLKDKTADQLTEAYRRRVSMHKLSQFWQGRDVHLRFIYPDGIDFLGFHKLALFGWAVKWQHQ